MEARGIPAVVLGTDAFLSLARAAAGKHGMPHLSVALVPHPIGGIDPAVVRGKAETIAGEVLDALTRDPAAPRSAGTATATAVADAPDDLDAFQAWAVAERWSDGLPVLPPTAECVARVLGPRAARRGDRVAVLARRARAPAGGRRRRARPGRAALQPERDPDDHAPVHAAADRQRT